MKVGRKKILKSTDLCKICGKSAVRYQGLCKICYKKNWKKSNPEKMMFYGAKERARIYELAFTITIDDIVIPKRCPILGIPLIVNENKAGLNSPALDKIIPELGYIKGNIQVISHKANNIKNRATLEELVLLGKWAKRVINEAKRT